ncbi:MAG: isopentenyl phosphate kinase [Chloroflexi bacterium]|nr:isopentenyl phosphate kinase [Chloroflexota bacterium]
MIDSAGNSMTMPDLQFLKLGGSLITEKRLEATARHHVISHLAAELADVRKTKPGLRLLLGHGSGSFGHVPAQKCNTRSGVHTDEEWRGFIEVWQQAAALHRIVMDALLAAGLPAVGFPPSASVSAADDRVAAWNLKPIKAALDANLLPVVFGDVAFDSLRGGTILSTEDLFVHLAAHLHPSRVLLAGDEDGVYSDYASHTEIIPEITPSSFGKQSKLFEAPSVADVTGGMAGKVQAMLDLVQQTPGCQVRIFSGLIPGNLTRALSGESLGTLIHHN